MPHKDRWTHERDRPRERDRDRPPPENDFGQADYSTDYGYDPRGRTGYRTDEADDDYERRRYRDDDDYRGEERSWMDQARDGMSNLFGARAYQEQREGRQYRQGRVIWAVVNGRLDHERGLDPRDIEVIVDGSEVILNGTVRSREEKRLAEDLADVRGVTHVQNNLRVRRGWWR